MADQISPLGAPEAAKGDRVPNDYYPTPDAITLALKDLLVKEGLYEPSHYVFGPCAGEGAIAKHFPGSITNEPYWSGDFVPDGTEDALNPDVWRWPYEWIIENPPYGNSFPEKLLALAWPKAKIGVALHLRITWIEAAGDRRQLIPELWDHLRFVQSVNPRARFRRGSGCDSCTTAWFVWVKDWSWEAKGITNPFQYILDWR